VTVSSIEESEFYPTPEFRNLLTVAKRLRLEVTRLGAGVENTISYNRLLKDLDALEESLDIHFRELHALESALTAVASNGLTKKQRTLLRWLVEDYRGEEVYTALIERMSEELGIPSSTVRWNLRGLRETGLIMAGDRENKGIPVRLTARGMFMAECISLDAV